MSVVTTVIIVMGDDPDGHKLRAISKFTGTSAGEPLTWGMCIDPCGEHIGGYKCAECDIFIGAFNHFDWQGFLTHLRDEVPWDPWDTDSCVVLSSSDLESSEMFRPVDEADGAWRIPQQPQRQDSLLAQLHDLHIAAARLGMYDAADWLAEWFAVWPVARTVTPTGRKLVKEQ